MGYGRRVTERNIQQAPEVKGVNKVSVIIPTYNRANTIKRAIDSVLEQTYKNLEVIVVDDGSTDNTSTIIDSYKDSRLHYLRIEERHGANYARNVGIKEADGEYIAFQDSDDFWMEDKLEKQMGILEKESKVDVVWCRYVRIMISGIRRVEPAGMFIQDRMQKHIEAVLATGNVIGTPTMVIRKKCFEQAGAFDEEVQRFQDWELCIRFVQNFRFYFMDDILVEAYESEQSITNSSSTMEGLLSIIKKHTLFLERNGGMATHLSYMIESAAEEGRLDVLLRNIGEEFFLKGIDTYVRKHINLRKNFSFVQEYLKKGDSTERVNHYFANFSQGSIVIYGMGEIGRLLLSILTDENKKKIRFIVDRSLRVDMEYEILAPEQLEGISRDIIKSIVVTAVAHEAEIRKSIEKVTAVPVIGLYEIIRGKVKNDIAIS